MNLRENIGLNKLFNFSTYTPAIICLSVLAILLVLFRMKAIELDYKTIDYKRLILKEQKIAKELGAIKAKHLSIRSLRKFAEKFKLKRPNESKIIVIHD